jgi:hypothetical protein
MASHIKVIFSSVLTLICQLAVPTFAQSTGGAIRTGVEVPVEVERISKDAVAWLAKNQQSSGDWSGGLDSHNQGTGNCGVIGLAVMAFLSTGEDPNYGPYSKNIRGALRKLVMQQDGTTGYLPNSMYNHGFGMLALAEAYGVVDEELLWSDSPDEVPAAKKRSLGQALQLAVRCAVTSQESNPWKAWRYGPESRDADTSVTGAVLIGLLAAKNAGVKVPDASINDALQYIRDVTGKRGDVSYTPGFGVSLGTNMSAIACLTFAISKRQDWPEFSAVSKYLKANADTVDTIHPHYNLYYMSQALFQSDFETWNRWNQVIIRRLRREQNSDGSFDSNHGKAYGTSMSVLALALNYRFLPIYER